MRRHDDFYLRYKGVQVKVGLFFLAVLVVAGAISGMAILFGGFIQ